MAVHVWSALEEIIRYLKNMEISNQKLVLQDHPSAMTLKKKNIQLIINWTGISVFCNILEQYYQNRLSITGYKNTEKNNIENINFK